MIQNNKQTIKTAIEHGGESTKVQIRITNFIHIKALNGHNLEKRENKYNTKKVFIKFPERRILGFGLCDHDRDRNIGL